MCKGKVTYGERLKQSRLATINSYSKLRIINVTLLQPSYESVQPRGNLSNVRTHRPGRVEEDKEIGGTRLLLHNTTRSKRGTV